MWLHQRLPQLPLCMYLLASLAVSRHLLSCLSGWVCSKKAFWQTVDQFFFVNLQSKALEKVQKWKPELCLVSERKSLLIVVGNLPACVQTRGIAANSSASGSAFCHRHFEKLLCSHVTECDFPISVICGWYCQRFGDLFGQCSQNLIKKK